MDLDRQRVVVMGGSSGIGLATARALAPSGARVVITGRDQGKLDAAVGAIGGAVEARAVDATRRDQLDACFADLGPFDHLVLALSGGAGGGPFRTLDFGALRQGFEAKFWAHAATVQAALPTLRTDGSINFVSSISARMANPGTAGLAAINAAIEALIPPLAKELAPLRVNAVSPGMVDTPWWDALPEEQRRATFAQYAASAPVRRVGQPEDVAQVICLLIADTFLTGVVVPCDGGFHLG